MTLERSFRIAMLVLAATGVAAVGFALVSPVWLAVGLGGLAGHAALAAARPQWHLRRLAATLAVAAMVQVLIVEVAATGTLLVPGGHFLILLQLVLLAQERTARNYGLACVVSLVQMVVAAVLSVDLAFGLCLLLYLVAGARTLMLLNLRAELERSGAPVEPQTARVPPRLSASMGFILLAEVGLTVLVFLYFPRFGIQFFRLRPVQRGEAMAGFSDHVRFGDLARILDNPEVVMSARLFHGDEPIRADSFPLYWRGVGLDTYEDAEWSTADYIAGGGEHPLREERGFRNYVRSFPGDDIRQEIALEPVSSRILFYLPEIRELHSGTPNLDSVHWHKPSRTLSATRGGSVSLRYFVLSRIPEWRIAKLREPARFASEADRGRFLRTSEVFLQLPASLTPRVAALAARIVAGVPRDAFYDRAQRIEAHLGASYVYSLEGWSPARGVDPVEDFLFRARRGHCEYFASAMAILLRTLGIPSRVVTGFSGGEWNEYGQFYLIRQRHAHAWVEAYIPSVHDWVTFDPTPASRADRPPETGWMAGLDRRLAYLRLAWNSYIVNYSTDDQRRLADAANRLLARLSNAIPSWGEGWFSFGSGRSTGTGILALNALVAVCFCAFAFFGIRLLRRAWDRRGRRAPGTRPAVGFYRKLEAILRRRGYRRGPATTPLEFARSVIAEGGGPYAPAETVTQAFCRVRYGGRRLSAAERAEVYRALAALQAAPRGRKHSGQ